MTTPLTGKTPAATSAESLLQQAEVRSALFIQNDRLAVEDHCIVAELLRIVGNVCESWRPVVSSSGQHPDAIRFDMDRKAVAIPLDFK